MKKFTLLLIILFANLSFGQQQNVVYEVDPCTFDISDEITITILGSSLDEAAWGIDNGTNNGLYLWTWYNEVSDPGNNNDIGAATNGSFGNSNEANRFTYNPMPVDTYTYTLTPQTFYGTTNIGNIGFLVKPKDGTTGNQTGDYEIGIGDSSFSVNLSAPTETTLIVSSGGDVTISASNTCGLADYDLKINGTSVSTSNNVQSFTYNDTGITSNRAYSLEVTQGAEVRTLSVTAVVNPNTVSESLPNDLVEGINYNDSDPTKATLVIEAPFKDYVYVAGTFNDSDYQPKVADAMKKDSTPGSDKFFLELTGLTPGQIYTYQYWVVDETPQANSPQLVKTADPYSTLVLSPFDDPFIPATTYPNLPTYPEGQEREVTVLQTNQTPYPWVVTDFDKPKKEDLVIYEVLIRDFDSGRNYQDLIDRIDYFKALNINAIQLMPVMEFEGNESWGYNTSFHMALDKFYGTETKFREFIDLCHQNGIAVILDIALNHAFGRNPMVRMWMDDPDGDGWGGPSSENPYFNETPQHSYNVGSDFSHTEELPNTPGASSNDDTNPITNRYVERVIKHWIEDFKIDGFRWDLTKGFTQNCSSGDNFCTDQEQLDRVAILKSYADYSWLLDDDHYVIFEHLGSDGEEQQWANYRENEGKGIMMWGKMTAQYNELTMGQNGDKNISRMGHVSRGFTKPRLVGYPESHDEERLMYKNLQFGNNFNGYDITDLDTALGRMSALAAISVTIPGPKMIWHFGDLGLENSIFTCSNGLINLPGDADGQGDCKLDTKPQPQWPWYDAVSPTGTDAIRQQIFNDWARLHELKITEPVFEGDYTITNSNGNAFLPRIDVFDTSIPLTELRNVIILSNFDVVDQSVPTNFPGRVTPLWFDLMDSSGSTSVSTTLTSINLAPGEFRIYGNVASQALSTSNFELPEILVYPNPADKFFKINIDVSDVLVYDITGKLVTSFKGNLNRNKEFDISPLKHGIYLIKFKTEDGKERSSKLIKL